MAFNFNLAISLPGTANGPLADLAERGIRRALGEDASSLNRKEAAELAVRRYFVSLALKEWKGVDTAAATASTRTDLEFVTVDGQLLAEYALPIEEIPPSDFIWQRHPFKLDGGHDGPEEYPGIDMFLPYWMGRQIGVLIVPFPGDADGDGVVDDDELLTVTADEGTVKEILKLYGDKFPSSLPRRIDFDETKWYRAEVEMILARLKKLIPVDKLTRIDWFNSNFNKLLNTAELPGFDIDVAKRASVEEKQQLYDAVAAWWERSKDDARWNKETGKLKAKDE